MKRFFPLFLIIISFLVFHPIGQKAMCATYEADYMPWSGYWWPFTAGGVVTGTGYKGHPAPLEKYDLVTVGRENGPATNYGMQHYYDPQALKWEGLCFNWAAAAILEPEPVHKGIYQNTTFLVGDKKALLTVAYDGALYNVYPIRDPADFHGLLAEFIAGQKMPISMDLGTDGQIWFYPVFKYDIQYTQQGSIRHYTATIYYASDGVRPDYTGTSVSSSTYYYYFELNGEGSIMNTGWEMDSVGRAPVRACEPFGTEPNNPGIDYDLVKQIVSTDDDPYEENDSPDSAAAISTGAYHLIAADDDSFDISLKQGDRLYLELAAETENIFLKTYDPGRRLLDETAGAGTQIIEAEVNGEYTIDIIADEPENEYEYTLYLEHCLDFRGVFPVNPSGSWSTGISLFDRDGIGGRKIISLFDDSGHPLKSCSIQPGASLVGVIEGNFGLTHERKGYIKVDSDSRLLGLEASMALDYLMLGANLIPLDEASREIFYPLFSNSGGWKTSFGLLNTGDYTEEVLRTSYGDKGETLETQTVVLAPGERLEEETSYLPILVRMRNARCMSAKTLSGRACLIGYIKFFNPSFGSKGRDLVTLTGESHSEIMIPNVACDEYWWTGIAVMNTGYNDSEILCLAYDDNGSLLGTAEYLLSPKENLVQLAPDLFPGTPAGYIASTKSIKISSQNGEPLCGLILYGSKDNNSLGGMPVVTPRELPIFLPHIASTDGWWTGIGLANASTETASILFSLLDEDNNILDQRDLSLTGNAQLSTTICNLFPDSYYKGARFLKIDSVDNPLVGAIYLMGTHDGLRLMGDRIR